MASVCLSMIVKNESQCIEKCLESVKKFIDYWIICDTGSTDGTQEIIKNYLKDIPGELHQHTWVDFSTNRNLSLNIAKQKAEYIFMIDADDLLINKSNFKDFKSDIVHLNVLHNNISYMRPHLVKSNLDCQFVGVIHEYLKSNIDCSHQYIKDISIKIGGNGNRSKDPLKYLKDAEVLEKALINDPNNERYIFYTAQAYRDASYTLGDGYANKAILFYNKRLFMGGWEEERFVSAIEIAKILHRIKPSNVSSIENYLIMAYNILPTRAESLYYLSFYFRQIKMFEKAYFYAKIASLIKEPDNGLFIDNSCYKWKIKDELAISAFYTNRKEEAKQLSFDLLLNKEIPLNDLSRIKNNLICYGAENS